jgi:hypothetical protein
MSIAAAAPAPELLRRAARLQMLTIVWMSVEAIVASTAAWTARSPALLGFGGDSAIELFSAIIVLWRFRAKSDLAVAEQLAGGRSFALCCRRLRHRQFRIVCPGVPRSAIQHPRHHRVNCGGHRYAVAGKSETESGNSSCERGVESRRNGIRCLWVFVADRFGRTVGKRHFSRSVADPIAALALVPLIAREAWQAVHASRQCCNCFSV